VRAARRSSTRTSAACATASRRSARRERYADTKGLGGGVRARAGRPEI
jgi:hypothetical protein